MLWPWSKRVQIVVLVLVIAVGFFLRSYHFTDWLHFELDQSRDALVIDRALDGDAADLPLLGPKAAGTLLRLPPTFYNLQYVSALVFGHDPAGMAVLVMLASTGSLLFFFLLARRYFSWQISLALTLLMAVSHFFVMYGRFAWNPNFVPFFTLLGWYGLLRSVDASEAMKRRQYWLIGGIVALTLATHFHFLALLTLPPAAVAFLFWARPRFSWRVWVVALGLALLTFTPVVLNEIKAGGTNTTEFMKAVTEKSDTGDDHVLIEKIIRNISEHALHTLVITTGYEGGTFPSFLWVDGRLRWNCPERCDAGKVPGVIAVLVLLLSVCTLFIRWYSESDQTRRNFLTLLIVWLAFPAALFTLLAYSVAPRFFLVAGPVFLFLIALFFQSLADRLPRLIGQGLLVSMFTALIMSNLIFLFDRFSELRAAPIAAVDSVPDRILKERVRVTLEQQNAIIDYLAQRSAERGFPIYMYSQPEYRRALKYLLGKRGIQNDVLSTTSIYQQGVYVLILRTQSDREAALKKYLQGYTVGQEVSFGTLTLTELIPRLESIKAERQDFTIEEKEAPAKSAPRYTWREFFADQSSSGEGDEGDEEVSSEN